MHCPLNKENSVFQLRTQLHEPIQNIIQIQIMFTR